MKQGGILSVLMGHAMRGCLLLDAVRRQADFLCPQTMPPENSAKGLPCPLWSFFPASPGTFTTKPCQAKSLLFFPGGPVATIGATTESHPLT